MSKKWEKNGKKMEKVAIKKKKRQDFQILKILFKNTVKQTISNIRNFD